MTTMTFKKKEFFFFFIVVFPDSLKKKKQLKFLFFSRFTLPLIYLIEREEKKFTHMCVPINNNDGLQTV